MAVHVESLNIASYRGITDLIINDLCDINIFVGDNNCGKTSLMEAVQLLSSPNDFGNIVMVARQRDRFRYAPSKYMQSHYTSFLNIFSKLPNQTDLKISLGCRYQGIPIFMSLNGEIKKSLAETWEINKSGKVKDSKDFPIDEEVDTFFGTLHTNTVSVTSLYNDSTNTRDVSINKYSRIMRLNSEPDLFPVQFVSSVEHVMVDRFRMVLRNKKLTTSVISLLQSSFDSQIQDMRMLEEDDGRLYQVIDHTVLGYMPLSTYGDGIRKTLALAGTAAAMKDGVLLIDEYETALHPKAMSQVFDFMVKICAERNLQLFLTTHSIEAVEKLLQCGGNQDNIRVITLYKNENNTTARVLSGSKALVVKNELGLELR